MSRLGTLADHCLHKTISYIPDSAFEAVASEYAESSYEWPAELIGPYEIRKALREGYLLCLD